MWLKIKDERKKPNLNEILKMIIKKRKEEAKNKGMPKKPEDVKKVEIVQNLDPVSQKYHDIYQDIFGINMKILDSGNDIDSIEKRIITL